MKTNRRNAFLGAALGTFIFTHTSIQAQTSTWAGTVNNLANGAWGTAGNWTAGVPDSSTSIALLTKDWTGTAPTFALGANRTLTGLEYQDTGASNDITGSINSGNTLTMAGADPYVTTNNSFTFNNVLAGTVGMRKLGGVTLTLKGANTISGTLNVIDGILRAEAAGALGNSTSILVQNAANPGSMDTNALELAGGFTYGSGKTLTLRNNSTSNISNARTQLTNASGNNTWAGPIILDGGTNQTLQSSGGVLTITGNVGVSATPPTSMFIRGTASAVMNGNFNLGTTNIAKTDAGSWTINSTGNTHGQFTVANGSVILNNNDALAPATNINFGEANTNTGILTINAGFTQTVGNVTVPATSTSASGHSLNGPGSIDLGASTRTFTINQATAIDDLTITGATVKGSGGTLTKEGDGTLALKNVTVEGTLTVNAGTLATAGIADASASSVSIGSLVFGPNPTNLRMKVGAASDLITAGSLTTNGTATITLNQSGGLLANGTYPLIAYSGTTPGLTGFSLNPLGHSDATLVDTGSAIAVTVTTNDSIFWTGDTSNNWAVGDTNNWKLTASSVVADYIEGDVVIFPDASFYDVVIPADVTPSAITFNNTVASPYSLSGAGRIIGTTGLTKSGNGSLTINNVNIYSGPTNINQGSVIANFTAGTAIPTTSAITMAAGSSLTLGHNGGIINLNNAPVGSGTLIIDPNFTTAGNQDLNTATWDASVFTGTTRLSSTVGTMRLQANAVTDVGSGPVEITNGAQLYINTTNLTFPNNFTITGTGYTETAGNLGAIRATGTTNLTGTITVSGSGKIGALGGTAIVSNTLTGGDLTFGGSINNTGSEILAITGDASGLTSLTVNDGSATSGGASIVVNVGNGGTTGSLGTVPVTLKPDGFKNAALRYDRSDGYTLTNPITSSATAPANEVRNYLDMDCTGTGFNDNGATITLGSAAPASGGTMRVGQSRADALATLSGTLTGERLWIASGQNNATLNLGSTADLQFNAFNLSESANNSATVNHPAGATVEVVGQLRVSHYGTNTSTYNLSGGSLTLTGDSPISSPSTAAAGANGTNGDNNLNTLNPQQIVGGGVYIGIDGTGIMNHTGGTLTTNWIVLDNRGNSGAGVNMPDGIDRYNLSGAGLLKLRSTWGLIARNTSTDVSFGGGTVQVDNTGTGTGTGADLNIPLDAAISTVTSTTTTLDTNGATNAFTLTKDVTGSGTLALTGGGTVNLSSAANQNQNIAANLSSSGTSANLDKLGTGVTTLAGNMAGFTGNVKVSEGRLNVPASLNTAVTVEGPGTLSGEVSLSSLTLNGGMLLFDPNTGGSLSATTLNLNGASLLDVSAAPGVGTFPAITFGTVTGGGSLTVDNAANYRTPPVVSSTTTSPITVQFFAGKALTWTGAASALWDINNGINWTDNLLAPEKFYSGDSVTFPTGVATTNIALTGLLAPAGVSVTSDDTTNYTFTSSDGNQLTGTTGLTKSNTSTLTLVGPNAYSGITSISGGTIAIASDSLGSGVSGNSIALSGGGKLSYTGAVAADLGINRSIAVGTGGGILEHNNATGVTIAIPGALSGSEALTFQSAAAGGGTFALSGNNAAYAGAIALNSVSTGLSTLRIDNTAAVPTSGSITINHPALGAAAGNANTLSLWGLTTPAGLEIALTCGMNGTLSMRSQITYNGDVVVNSPLKLTGPNTGTGSIVQISGAGNMTLNGNISEATPGSFGAGNTFFPRGTSPIILNGTVNLPGAGFAHTEAGVLTINSTGNVWGTTSINQGSMVLGTNDALATAAPLSLGQNDNVACTLTMAGFNQTVAGLRTNPTTGTNANNKLVTSATLATLSINNGADDVFAGYITGPISVVKAGSFSQTLGGNTASSYTGNVTVNEGTLVAGGTANSNALGSPTTAGRTVTVNSGAILSFATNNVFGNGNPNPDLPAVVINGGTLTSTRYNVLGNVTLNAGTLTQSSTDAAGYFGYHFRGSVTVGGGAASTISTGNAKANHLGPNVTFTVADATSNSDADLIVSAPLTNQSADFLSAEGALTKEGAGTMSLGGINTYTGNTTVNAGTLELANDAQLRFVIGATSGTNNSLSGTGTVTLEGDFAIDLTAAAALTTGTWVLENVGTSTYGANFQVVDTAGTPWTNAGGNKWTKDGGAGKTWTFDEATGTLTVAVGGYDSWATQIPNPADRDRTDDPDGDGFTNLQEFLFGTLPHIANGALVTTQKSGSDIILRWSQRENGASYLLKESTTMGVGSWTTSAIVPALDDATPVDYDIYKATIPTGAGRKFFRVEGTEN